MREHLDYHIVQFYRHPKIDRKVMVVAVSEEGKETRLREFYWERDGYMKQGAELPDSALIAEMRELLRVPSNYPPLMLP